jgi:hypothetical protein
MIELTRRAFPLAAAASFAAFGADPAGHRTTKRIQLPGSDVRLITIEAGRGLTYFHPHENEHASAAVARALVRERGGKLLEIESRGTRLISFTLNGASYTFDPNRMFTEVGLQKSLANYSHSSAAAMDAIQPLSSAVLTYLKNAGGPIVAVHNNAANGMNIGYYQGSGPYAKEADDVARNAKAPMHDFFLVLDAKLFAALKHLGFNVVLQAAAPTDDGSLSVYCRQNGLRYVNVEAAEGHTDEQKRMLEVLQRLLR